LVKKKHDHMQNVRQKMISFPLLKRLMVVFILCQGHEKP
jgi:hypothetical protein